MPFAPGGYLTPGALPYHDYKNTEEGAMLEDLETVHHVDHVTRLVKRVLGVVSNIERKMDRMTKAETDLLAAMDRNETATTAIGDAIKADLVKLQQALDDEGVENDTIAAVTTRLNAMGDALTQDVTTLTTIPGASDVQIPEPAPIQSVFNQHDVTPIGGEVPASLAFPGAAVAQPTTVENTPINTTDPSLPLGEPLPPAKPPAVATAATPPAHVDGLGNPVDGPAEPLLTESGATLPLINNRDALGRVIPNPPGIEVDDSNTSRPTAVVDSQSGPVVIEP